MIKKIYVLQWLAILLSSFFSLITISFHFDISFFAFIPSLIFSFALWYFGIVLFTDKKKISLSFIRKVYEYAPFILLFSFILRRSGQNETSYAYDFICVLVWVLLTICVNIFLYFTHPKRFYIQNKDFIEPEVKLNKKGKKKLSILGETFGWIDAFIQAALIVTLVNIFIFQLYEIPSESMVPEFLVGDRVVVFKTASGPVFPLSEVGLPELRNYKRGDIVVFRNPHYENSRKAELKNFLSQLVFMFSFTTVNLNVDENGNLKADPLVKRVCGLPGEQIYLLDGNFYARKQGKKDFDLIESDANWAAWDLNTLSNEMKSKIQRLPLSKDVYKTLLTVEEKRRAFDLQQAAIDAQTLSIRFMSLKEQITKQKSNKNLNVDNFLRQTEMHEYFLFTQYAQITKKLLTKDEGAAWFHAFLTSWIDADIQSMDPYEEALFRLNIMAKLIFAELVIRSTELISYDSSLGIANYDDSFIALLQKAEEIHTYFVLNDSRNMPVFPANKGSEARYLPHDSFFLMGDNRFNSLDMRHSYDTYVKEITKHDPYTMYYYSNMEQRAVSKSRILGTTSFRFWPLSRLGIPGNHFR